MSRSPNYDFFEAQRRLRRRSRVLIAGLFVLLWLVVNWLLIAIHSRQSCNSGSVCETIYYLNVPGLILTGLGVAAYLALASLLTSKAMVSGHSIHEAQGPEHAVLRNVVEEVAIASGVAVPHVFVLDDPARNAYAVSDGRKHGAVVVTSGLLAVVDRRELTGVIAHELAHIRNRDSRVLIVTVYAVGAIVVLATIAVVVSTALVDATKRAGKGMTGLFIGVLALGALFFALVFRLVAVPAAQLLKAALSRRREELADASAVQYTRDPGGLRRALEKVAADTALPRINELARALCIERPRESHASRLLGRWMGSHPPIEQRIAWLQALEGASGADSPAGMMGALPPPPGRSDSANAANRGAPLPAPSGPPASVRVDQPPSGSDRPPERRGRGRGVRFDWSNRRTKVAAGAVAVVGLIGVAAIAGDDPEADESSLDAGQPVSSPERTSSAAETAQFDAATSGPESVAVRPTDPPMSTTTQPVHATTAVVAVTTVAMTTPPTTAVAPSTTYDLSSSATSCEMHAAVRLGSGGADVRCLQQRLSDVTQGAAPIVVDGQFGLATDAAVREFQAANGLVVDGIAGAQTAALLGIWDPVAIQPAVGGLGGAPFRNCAEAHAAGQYNITPAHPRWSPRLDGDDDGFACE